MCRCNIFTPPRPPFCSVFFFFLFSIFAPAKAEQRVPLQSHWGLLWDGLIFVFLLRSVELKDFSIFFSFFKAVLFTGNLVVVCTSVSQTLQLFVVNFLSSITCCWLCRVMKIKVPQCTHIRTHIQSYVMKCARRQTLNLGSLLNFTNLWVKFITRLNALSFLFLFQVLRF